MKRLIFTAILFIVFFTHDISFASIRIAVLDFELNDITSLPNVPQEIKRTASIQNLLEQAIRKTGNYEIVHINLENQTAANSGLGYLFRFEDVAAKLGEQVGADWVVVGQHSKPSFLFSYLMAHLINVKMQKLTASYDIEIKGNHEKVTERGVNSLAKKINESIDKKI